MIPIEKKKWLEEQGELWINPDKHADLTGTWTDGSRVLETGEFYAIETLYCKVQHHMDKNGSS